MAHGKAILDYADEEGRQPLLAQFHEDIGALILTFFDIRLRNLVTITTQAGAEHFLRRAADLVDEDTGELQRIRSLSEQLEQTQGWLKALHTRLEAWGLLNGVPPGTAATSTLDDLINQVGQQMSMCAALNSQQERQLNTQTSKLLEMQEKLDRVRGNYHALADHGLLPAEDEIPF